MMSRKVLYVVLGLLIAALVAGCGEKEPEQGSLAAIKEKGVMVVGTSADYPPFEYIDENGEYAGFDIELIHEIGDRMGVEIQIEDMDFGILIGALKQGKVDAIIACMTATPEREEEVDFTIPYYESGDALVVKAGSGLTFNAPEEVAGLKIGVQTGTIYEEWVMENLVDTGEIDEKDLSHYPWPEQGIRDLESGRIDVMIMDLLTAEQLAAERDVEIALEVNLSGGAPAMAVREGSKELQEELNRIITELREEGFIDQLEEKYLRGQ